MSCIVVGFFCHDSHNFGNRDDRSTRQFARKRLDIFATESLTDVERWIIHRATFCVRSFDETSMDSCILATVDEGSRISDLSGESARDGNEVEVTSLEEAKSVIAALRARQRAQAHQMLAWRRTLKLQARFQLRRIFLHAKAIPFRFRLGRRNRPRGGKEGGGEGDTRNDRSKLLLLKTIKHARPEPMLRTVKY